jgi:hypothetical protein
MSDDTNDNMQIVRCVSCDGYGWIQEGEAEPVDCDWCGGTGYVYRDAHGIDRKIPEGDYGRVADTLETLETERMRDLGYTGGAKHPDEQEIRRQGTTDEDDV